MTVSFSGPCPVCGGVDFADKEVLWPELINTWQLTNEEVAYINRQQGFHCLSCQNNLRAMSLSTAILHEYEFCGTLNQFCDTKRELELLEINPAGNLSPVFSNLIGHELVEYPKFDMVSLDIESDTFELVVHSDTLEHISNPERALTECRRILRRNGKCIFTVPIVVDRISRSRIGLPPSYHGQQGVNAEDQLVHTEFGLDIWKYVLRAGFTSCDIFALEYPSALAIIAK